MISIALLLLGAVALSWPKVVELFATIRPKLPAMTPRHLAGLSLLAAAVLAIALERGAAPEPTPAPDAGPLSLVGMWAGPTASEDASTVGHLCLEVADELEFDSGQPHPLFTTGVAVDELRKAARVLRCRGISIGDRQPRARDAIARYLDEHVGVDGGPLTPAQRSAWIAAFRDVGRAACESAR